MPKKTAKPSLENVHFRVPAEEKRSYIAAAERSGLDLTTWLRQLARKASGLDVVGTRK